MDILFNVCVTTFILFVVSYIFALITKATAQNTIASVCSGLFLINMALWPVYLILWVWM